MMNLSPETAALLTRIDKAREALVALRPFEGELLKQLRAYYRVGLTWTSNALEGSSFTETETKVLLEDGLTVGGKPLRETLEAVGHAKAYDHLFALLQSSRLTPDDIRALHRLFYQAIDEANAGVWRGTRVIVTGSEHAFPAPDEVPSLMDALAHWMDTARADMHPVVFAALLHLRFVTVHPFVDGNGRVARLLMNAALIQSGYLPVIIPPILRADYLAALRAYRQGREQGDAGPFVLLAAQQEWESQKEIARLLGV